MLLSRNNLKIYSSLHRKIKRLEHGIFIAEGIKVCQELLKSEFSIENLYVTEKNLDLFPSGQMISNKDAERISNQKTHSGVLAIVKLPHTAPIIHTNKTVFVIDGINDPGNLGSIIRTLDWFGYDQLICSNNSVDAFNPKTIMASMGSVFRVYTHYIDLKEFINKYNNLNILASDTEGESIYRYKFKRPTILIFGNETHGISKDIISLTDQSITIPRSGSAESLNLSHSVAIFLSELNKS